MNPSSIEATQEHCSYCFEVLEAALGKQNLPEFPKHLPQVNVPVFVTFHEFDEELRGCIGTFTPGPIGKQLQKFTIQSAFNDHRFTPIEKQELPNLDVGVSMLINFEKNKKWDHWEVGKHGIIIDFTDSKGRGYGATFLPEVAAEQNWDKITTLRHLIRKAGYSKSIEDVLEKIDLTTYESSKVKLTYKEYVENNKKK